MNRTARDRQMSVTNAAARSAEMQRITRRLKEAEDNLQRLDAAVQDRKVQLDAATSEWFKGMVREELEELNREREDVRGLVSGFRGELQQFSQRLGTVENNVLGLGSRIEGLQVHSNAHATAIARLEAANGWIPLIGGVITALVVYFFIEGVEWVRGDRFTTQNQWFWAVLIGAIVAIVLTCLPGNGRSIITRSSASASGNVVVAPQPPADQPVAAVTPPPPPADQPLQAVGTTPPSLPLSGSQFSTTQAAAAATASAN